MSVLSVNLEPLEPRMLLSASPLDPLDDPSTSLANQARDGLLVGGNFTSWHYGSTRPNRPADPNVSNSTDIDNWAAFYDRQFSLGTAGSHPNPIISSAANVFDPDGNGTLNLDADLFDDSQYNYGQLHDSIDAIVGGTDSRLYFHAALYPQLLPDWFEFRRFGDNAAPGTIPTSKIVDLQDAYIRNVVGEVNARNAMNGGNTSVIVEVLNEIISPFDEEQGYLREAEINGKTVVFNGTTRNESDGTPLERSKTAVLFEAFEAETGKGENFVLEAFRSARAADPQGDDILVLNHPFANKDTGENDNRFDEEFFTVVEWLNDEGLIDGVGLQTHLHMENMATLEYIGDYIDRIEALGLDVYITEMDIALPNNAVTQADSSVYSDSLVAGVTVEPSFGPTVNITGGAADPYSGFRNVQASGSFPGYPGISRSGDLLQRQGQLYEAVVSELSSHAGVKGISFWSITDTTGWLNSFESLLGFRENSYEIKPAYWGVFDGLRDAPAPTIRGGAFQQQNNFNGVVSIEAENYDNVRSAGGDSWVLQSGGSDGLHMEAGPDNDTFRNTNYVDNSPRLDFRVDFKKTGVHYVWVRGRAGGSGVGSSDSVHVGLNGNAVGSSDRLTGWGPGFGWENRTMDNNSRATINVTSTGVQTVNVWMREDGFDFDKIVLSTNPNYAPGGAGPVESDRAGGGGGNVAARVQVDAFSGVLSNGQNTSTVSQWDRQTEGNTTFAWVPNGATKWFASSGQPSGNSPRISQTLSGMQGGTYDLRVRANVNDEGSNGRGANDSFFIRVNGGSWTYVNLTLGDGQNRESGFANGWFIKRFDNLLQLNSGNNTIEIAAREDGTKLDWIGFVKS
ncbi:MAG: endo-1,4-beta-xylanase [Planctomycetota bacterium]